MSKYDFNTMPKCDFISNFIEIALQHGCSPVNLLYILRTSFLGTHLGGWLVLYLEIAYH